MRKQVYNENSMTLKKNNPEHFANAYTTSIRNYSSEVLNDVAWYYMFRSGSDAVVYAAKIKLSSIMQLARKRTKKDCVCYSICKRERNGTYTELALVWNNRNPIANKMGA